MNTAGGASGGGGANVDLDVVMCGSPGQPKCKIDEEGTPVGKGTTFAAGDAALDAAKASTLEKIVNYEPASGKVTPGTGAFGGFGGSDGCSNPFTLPVLNMTFTPDVCAVYGPFKAVLSWFLWVMLALFAWHRINRGAIGGVG
jgi:hypothetical protein